MRQKTINRVVIFAVSYNLIPTMKVSIIASGFQEQYTFNLKNSLANHIENPDFNGSGIYPEIDINFKVNFLNIREEYHDEVSTYTKSSDFSVTKFITGETVHPK